MERSCIEWKYSTKMQVPQNCTCVNLLFHHWVITIMLWTGVLNVQIWNWHWSSHLIVGWGQTCYLHFWVCFVSFWLSVCLSSTAWPPHHEQRDHPLLLWNCGWVISMISIYVFRFVFPSVLPLSSNKKSFIHSFIHSFLSSALKIWTVTMAGNFTNVIA